MSSLIAKVRKFTRLVHSSADLLFIAVPDGTKKNDGTLIMDWDE